MILEASRSLSRTEKGSTVSMLNLQFITLWRYMFGKPTSDVIANLFQRLTYRID